MFNNEGYFKILAFKSKKFLITYFISAFIILGFSCFAIVIFFMNRNFITIRDVFFLVVAIYFCLYAVSTLISLVGIILERVYIEITNEFIKYNKIFSSKLIKLSDIEVIRKAPYEKTLSAIIITERRTKKAFIKKIKIPEIWFKDKDMENLLSYIKNKNKKIEWYNISI